MQRIKEEPGTDFPSRVPSAKTDFMGERRLFVFIAVETAVSR